VPFDRRAETARRRGACFAVAPGHALRVFGIEMARLGDKPLDRLARFVIDDLAENLDDWRHVRRRIVLRSAGRIGLNWCGPDTGQDKDHQRGAPDQESNDRCARIKHWEASLQRTWKPSDAAGPRSPSNARSRRPRRAKSTDSAAVRESWR